MASTLFKLYSKTLSSDVNTLCGSVRWGHHIRGKAPGIAKSLEQKMKGLKYSTAPYFIVNELNF